MNYTIRNYKKRRELDPNVIAVLILLVFSILLGLQTPQLSHKVMQDTGVVK